jgi:NitT/TauT family transport system substrate-binding protein
MRFHLLFCSMLFLVTSVYAEAKFEVRDRQLNAVSLVLNWVPEPEFGGFYAAETSGAFDRHGLRVTILPGAAGTPTIQMLNAGKVDFAITSGAEVAIARSRGAKVVAVFSAFDKSPMGIMVHQSPEIKSLADFFQRGGTLALQQGQAYVDYLQSRFDFSKVRVVPYAGGVSNFLRDKNFAQQGFIFSEPVVARRSGAPNSFFLLADEGYNPYTLVMAVREEDLIKREDVVRRMVLAVREGWEAYLNDPIPANKVMGRLNRAMDEQTFQEATQDQKPLIKSAEGALGAMTVERWQTHIDQLLKAKSITKKVEAEKCFRNF